MAWYTDTVEKVHLVSHSGHFSTSSTSGIGALQKECWRSRSEHILLWPAFWAIFEISNAEPRVTFRLESGGMPWPLCGHCFRKNGAVAHCLEDISSGQALHSCQPLSPRGVLTCW